MKSLTPTQAAQAWLIRNYGCFVVSMSEASKKQLVAAYIAGCRHGRNGNNHRR